MFLSSIRKKRTPREWLSYLIAQIVAWFTQTWWVMLALGGVHHDVSEQVPALGYWQTMLVLLVLTFAIQPTITDGVKGALREELS